LRDLLVLESHLLGPRLVSSEEPRRHLAAEAAGQRDESIRVLGKQRLVDARLVVIALEVRPAGEHDQVAVAGQVLDQEDQVVRIPVGASLLLVHRSRRDLPSPGR